MCGTRVKGYNLIRWLRAFTFQRQQFTKRRNAISNMDGGAGDPAPLIVMVATMEENPPAQEVAEIQTYDEACVRYDAQKWDARITEVVTVDVASIIDDLEDQAAQEAERVAAEAAAAAAAAKLQREMNAGPSFMQRMSSKTSSRKAGKSQSAQRKSSQRTSTASSLSEASRPNVETPLRDLPCEITLIKMRAYDGNAWKGKFSSDSGYWTEEFCAAVGYDDIGDGSFWVSLREFCLHFAHWGVIYRPLLTSITTAQSSWYECVRSQLYFSRHHSAPSFGTDLAHRSPSAVIQAQDVDFLLVEVECFDALKTYGANCDCTVSVSPNSHFASDSSTSVSIGRSRKKTIILDMAELESISRKNAMRVYIRATLQHAGVEGICTIRALGMRSKMFYAQNCPLKTLPLPQNSRLWSPRVVIKPITQPFASHEEAEAMAPRVWPTRCLSCNEFAPKNAAGRVTCDGLTWHRSAECYKCSVCGRPFDLATPPSKSNFVWGPRPPAFTTIVNMKAFCMSCWIDEYADDCPVCGEKLDLHGDCEACATAARIAAAAPCFICKEPLCFIEGRFTGRCIDCNGGNIIHRECEQAYKEFVAPRCFFCAEPMCLIPGKFSGRKKKCEFGKLHQECWDAFRRELKVNPLKFDKLKRR